MTELLMNIDPDLNHYGEDLDEAINSNRRTRLSTIDEYNNLLEHTKSGLSFLNFNIRSYNANSDELHSIFNSMKSYPDVLTLTETRFTADYTEDLVGYRSYHSVRTGRRSGGVSVYVKNEIKSEFFADFSFVNDNIEICSVKLDLGGLQIIVLGIYRPHSGTVENFSQSIAGVLSSVNSDRKSCLIMGDFNINLFNETTEIEDFKNQMSSQHLYQCITLLTRLSDSSSSLIDHIWFNSFMNFRCGVISVNITDHLPSYILLDTNIVTNPNEKIKITFRLNTEENRSKFNSAIQKFNWSSLRTDDLNNYVMNFQQSLNAVYCDCFPLKVKYISSKQIVKPWINSHIRKLIKAKASYFELYRLGIVTKLENNRYKNKVKTIIDKYKIDYYHRKFDERNNNIRGTWNLIKSLISSGVNTILLKTSYMTVLCTQIAMKWLKFSIITSIT